MTYRQPSQQTPCAKPMGHMSLRKTQAHRRSLMLASHTRSVLLAGLLTAALCAPAWSGDGDASKPETTGADLPLALATSPPVEPGPVVDRESLTKDVNAQAVVEGENEPTRTH